MIDGLRPPSARLLLLIIVSLVINGCSVLSERDPSERTVFCNLEYQPDKNAGNNDLLFLAATQPYRYDTFHMSLPDVLFHGVFAPRRHLIRDAVVRGADCSGGVWPKGYRLPTSYTPKKIMICRRNGDEEVLFEVTTRSGTCTQRIPAGDTRARELDALRSAIGLPALH